MYLKSLELTGFKSFAEAKIEFPQGITAVVGPNGTGKSNVVDAVLWVLGEQSTKTLRSERMEDVIFNGTESRKPLGMAEVSLIIAGLGDQRIEGIPPLPNPLSEYHEVMITRRLYRNGESEYLINKTLCRLKDIRSLLLETRAGIKGHTIIEQGRIDQILNASPRDRRELIEETAGIVRYKKQKGEALRKLEATQQNLLRVRDVVTEVRRQLNSLERQAQQARRYQRLHEQAKALEIHLLVRDARGLQSTQSEIESELQECETKEAAQAAEQARLTIELEKLRFNITAAQESMDRIRNELGRIEQQQNQAITTMEVETSRADLLERQRVQASEDLARLCAERDEAETVIGTLQSRLAQHDAELARANQALSGLEEKGRALAEQRSGFGADEEQARQEILQSAVELTNRENQLGQLEARQEELVRRREELETEHAELKQQRMDLVEQQEGAVRARHEAESQLGQLRGHLQAKTEEVRRLDEQLQVAAEQAARQQEALAAVESRIGVLDGLVREGMGYGRAGEEESTSLRTCEGIREAVAEWLSVPPGLERAVEAVLGERGRAWLVEQPAQACRAIEFLKEKELGRGSFLPVRPRWSRDAAEHQASGLDPHEPGVVGWALNLLSTSNESVDILRCLFEGVLVVESLDVALRLWERGRWSAPAGPKMVTLSGELLDASGVVTGGEVESSGGLLQRRHEVQEHTAQRDQLAKAVDKLKEARDQLAADAESGRAGVKRFEEEIRTTEMRLLTLRKDEEGLGEKLGGVDRRADEIKTALQQNEEEETQFQGELDIGREQLLQLAQQRAVREAGLADLATTLSVIEEKSLDLQGRLTEARLGVASLAAQREHDEVDQVRLLKEQEDRRVRLVALEEHIGQLAAASQQSQAERARNESLARELGERADQVRAEYVSVQETQAGEQAICRQVEAALEVVRKALTSSREDRMAVEVRRAEVKTHLATVESTLSGTYQLSLAAAFEQSSQSEEEERLVQEGKSDEDISLALREKLQTLRGKVERMGPINLAAIEEHQALEERHSFLTTQEQDLTSSIKSLKEIIQRINKTTQRMFADTFNELQEKFGEVFGRFFPGGRAELVLVDTEGDQPEGEQPSGDPGVDIVAQPPGKRLKNIAMLSGGEKTLTAMALIFASFLIRPTPFCVLDEIDAPLDEENIGRFADVLRELAARAQFIVITHNKRTMSIADSLFGVTMEDPGVSQLLSIRLADLQPA